jgi:vibriolysin
MKKLLPILLLCAATALARNPEERFFVKDVDAKGVPTFVTGHLGRLAAGSVENASRDFLRAQTTLLPMQDGEDFEAIGSLRDEFGQTHVRMQQRLNGLLVIGAEYIVHSDDKGNVIGMNGRAVSDAHCRAIRTSTPGPRSNRPRRSTASKARQRRQSAPRLRRQRARQRVARVDRNRHAQGQRLRRSRSDLRRRDHGRRRHARRDHPARAQSPHAQRQLHHHPPRHARPSETSGTTSDVSIQKAHDYAGVTYNYYSTIHGRDSYNGAGATITSSVHYGSNYNNAG